MIAVNSAGLTDVGKKRKGNEDALIIDDKLKLYVVADGMGGHLAGEIASKIVVDTIPDSLQNTDEQSVKAESIKDIKDDGLSPAARMLLSGINLANHEVFNASRAKESCRGMGSTVSAICFTDETFIVANVGDSPIYMIHKGEIETISVPHTLLAEQEAIDPDKAKQFESRYKHILTRAIGVKENVQADICEIQSFKNDILVICSDGLSDKVSPEEIRDLVKIKAPEEACQALVELANNRGGDDNITVIVIKIIKTGKKKESGISGFFSRIANVLANIPLMQTFKK